MIVSARSDGDTTRLVGAASGPAVGKGVGFAAEFHLNLTTTLRASVPLEFTLPLRFLEKTASSPSSSRLEITLLTRFNRNCLSNEVDTFRV